MSSITNAIITSMANNQANSNKKSDASSDAFQAMLAKNETMNAPIVQTRTREQKQTDLMLQRIREVGIKTYTQEQAQVKKMMKILNFIESTSKKDMRAELDKIIEHFKDNPPKNIDEMRDYIKGYVKAISPNAPDALKDRMEKMMDDIDKMMRLTDEQLDKLISDTPVTNPKD